MNKHVYNDNQLFLNLALVLPNNYHNDYHYYCHFHYHYHDISYQYGKDTGEQYIAIIVGRLNQVLNHSDVTH